MLVVVQGLGNARARDDDASYLVTGKHHARATGVECEWIHTRQAAERVFDDHERPLQTLPDFRGVDEYSGRSVNGHVPSQQFAT